jgi:hypothetical protein
VYPSPGQSFLTILQPGQAGFSGIDFRKRRLCGFSIAIVCIEFIWWTTFKDKIAFDRTYALAKWDGFTGDAKETKTQIRRSALGGSAFSAKFHHPASSARHHGRN